jgi:hypothetical protein
MPSGLGTEFDIDNLLRMDSVTQMEVLEKASGVMTIDEKRGKIGLKPVEGGASVYLQQQNFSLEALAKRDAQDNPFAKGESPTPATPEPSAEQVEGQRNTNAIVFAAHLRKALMAEAA